MRKTNNPEESNDLKPYRLSKEDIAVLTPIILFYFPTIRSLQQSLKASVVFTDWGNEGGAKNWLEFVMTDLMQAMWERSTVCESCFVKNILVEFSRRIAYNKHEPFQPLQEEVTRQRLSEASQVKRQQLRCEHFSDSLRNDSEGSV